MPYNRTAALRCLHILGKQKGFDHDALRDLASTFFNLDPKHVSLSKLTNSQLGSFIAHLKGAREGAPLQVPNSATDKQLWKIRQFEAQLGWQGEPERLQGFLFRQCKKRNLSELNRWDAQKVIDGLKFLSERGTTEAQ